MQRSRPIAKPEGLSQILVLVCLAVAVVVIAVYLPRAVSDLGDVASNNAALSYSDREIAGGNGIVVDQEAAYQARALIPAHARYRVVTGSGVKGATNLTPLFVDAWFRTFLMPRRPASDAHWVICYACDLAKLGGRYSVVWQNGGGISIGRLS